MVENVFILDFQRKVAGEILRVFPEDHIHILDLGGGPTVYQHALASLSADRITHSDLLPQNLKEVQHWVDGASNAYDWDAYFGLLHECDLWGFMEDRRRIISKIDTQRYNPFKSKNPGVHIIARLRMVRLNISPPSFNN